MSNKPGYLSSKAIPLLIALLISLCLFTSIASAYTIDDVEWTSSSSYTLHWGDTVENGDVDADDEDTDKVEYIIKAEDFTTDGYVHLSLSEGGEIKEFSFLHVGQNFEYRDVETGQDIRIFAKTITLNIDEWTGNMEDPTAEIEVYRRGYPNFDITITTDESEYDPKKTSTPKDITTTITVKNNGDAEAKNVKLVIDPDVMELSDGDLTHDIFTLEKDEITEPIEVKFKVPHLWDETDIDIIATVESNDINNDIHVDEKEKTIKIEPKIELIVTKSVTKEIYMDETAHVLVTVRNAGIYAVNSINIKDEIIDGVELKDSVTLEKTISLNPGQTEEVFSYSLKPIKTGTFTSPEAIASFIASNDKEYTYESEEPTLEINGPDIVITQTVSNTNVAPGEEITVTVTTKNEGNRDASTRIASTQFPEGTTFISGDTTLEEVLTSSQSESYSYILKMNEVGTFKIPAASGTFIDMEDFKGEKISNMPTVTVAVPVETDTPSQNNGGSNDPSTPDTPSGNGNIQMPDEEEYVQPGFEGIFAIGALAGVFYILRRRD